MAGVAVGFEGCGVPGCRRSESGRHAGGGQGGVCGHGLTIEGTDGAGEAGDVAVAVGTPLGDPAEGAGEVGSDVGGAVEAGGDEEADTLGAAVTEPVGVAVAEVAGDWLGEGSPYDT
ncbi:hypothetical protein [Microbispora sp. KK1-11]|uniref:hypothetical protein n=1 Tax=Microbispora sp. KK1-11 TaxID=2053005 RepID=UPI00163C26CF|nr:hypothetical protein [Microbispora sp. KK1-11]